MSVIDHSTMSSVQRPVRLRARKDIVISESLFQGQASWIVKDPLAMKYFRLREPEHEVLRMLDGKHSYHQIKTRLQQMFPEQTIRVQDVQQLTNSFHRNGILISDASGQTRPLIIRRHKELKQKAIGLLSSIVSLRFPGVDPERFLTWAYPKVRWFFTIWFTYASLVLIGAAAILVLLNFDEFMAKMPDFEKFFGLNNLMFMAAILIVTKTIHELGHGLMCKHFGGECHEIGFMLLVLMPAMYCNTSDSWVLPNKWHRIAIGAAGMWVEIVLAAMCTFVWWYTEPGALHYLCLNVMFLSSISTIVFNANPLLRYDGYYMLSDFLEIPNLAQKSKTAMISKLRSWCLGMKPVNKRMLPERNQTAFAIYSISAFVYRWAIMLLIFWFLTEVFAPYGLEVLGHIAIAISLIGMVLVPLFKMIKFFLFPGRFREVKKVRTALTASLLAFAIWAICYIPLPHYVWASFVVRPAGAQKVYVEQPGSLEAIKVVPGAKVVEGQELAKLDNETLEIGLLTLKGELASLEADYEAYGMLQDKSPNAARQMGNVRASISRVKRLIKIRESQIDSLTLVADREGWVIPPPNQIPRPTNEMTLASWSGSPLDPQNQSALLTRETLFCFIGDPNEMNAQLVVDQSDIKFLTPDQKVTLLLDQNSNRRIESVVASVSRNELTVVPRELSKTNGGAIATVPGMDGERPLIKAFEAIVELHDVENVDLLPGMTGQAKIRVGSASLGWRMWRLIQTVVNFR